MKILVRTLETDLATKARGYKQLKRIGFKLIKREENIQWYKRLRKSKFYSAVTFLLAITLNGDFQEKCIQTLPY